MSPLKQRHTKGKDHSSSNEGKKGIGLKPPVQKKSAAGQEENGLMNGHTNEITSSFLSTVQKKDDTVNGITPEENAAVNQLTGGQVNLHASGAKVEETSSSDSRLKSVGARSMAVGGEALIGDKQDRGHEIWHLAQQEMGMVKPTTSVNNQPVNDDPSLEKDADVMGAKIMQGKWKPEMQMKSGRYYSGEIPGNKAIQRVIDGDKDSAAIIEKHTARKDVFAKIEKDGHFTLTLCKPEESLDENASAVTDAIIHRTDKNVPVHSVDNALTMTKDDMSKMKSFEVLLTVAKKVERYATGGGTTDQNEPGYLLAVMHEMERHVYPFYELYEKIKDAQDFNELLQDPSKIDELHTETSTVDNKYTPLAQHVSPDLSTNTAVAVMSALKEANNAGNTRKALFGLYMDTINRGMGVKSIEDKLPAEWKTEAIWTQFKALAVKLTDARRGEDVAIPRVGDRVIIMDGAFRGCEGVIYRATRHVASADNDITVDVVEEKKTVDFPKSWCLFLR